MNAQEEKWSECTHLPTSLKKEKRKSFIDATKAPMCMFPWIESSSWNRKFTQKANYFGVKNKVLFQKKTLLLWLFWMVLNDFITFNFKRRSLSLSLPPSPGPSQSSYSYREVYPLRLFLFFSFLLLLPYWKKASLFCCVYVTVFLSLSPSYSLSKKLYVISENRSVFLTLW